MGSYCSSKDCGSRDLHKLRLIGWRKKIRLVYWAFNNEETDGVLNVDRRMFLQGAAAAALTASMQAQTTPKKMIGIQVGAVSFFDEGTEKVLDEFQRDAAVNTLFLATFTYGRGIAGRQVPGQPLPDHGKQEYDTGTFYGGNYATIHPEFYKDTVFQGTRATDLGDYDVLQAVLPAARKRGIKTICWFEDVFRKDLPNIDQL